MTNPYQELLNTLVPTQTATSYVDKIKAKYYVMGYDTCPNCNNFITSQLSKECVEHLGHCINCETEIAETFRSEAQ